MVEDFGVLRKETNAGETPNNVFVGSIRAVKSPFITGELKFPMTMRKRNTAAVRIDGPSRSYR
jgi:hypothetical protein